MLSDVEFKIDNLDARNLRQLNQLYAEIQKVEGESGIATVHQLLVAATIVCTSSKTVRALLDQLCFTSGHAH